MAHLAPEGVGVHGWLGAAAKKAATQNRTWGRDGNQLSQGFKQDIEHGQKVQRSRSWETSLAALGPFTEHRGGYRCPDPGLWMPTWGGDSQEEGALQSCWPSQNESQCLEMGQDKSQTSLEAPMGNREGN